MKRIFAIALPAILTNIATPIGAAYVIYEISKFGESAVAGMAVINRLTPVSFAVVFAASGAVGPIIGQNFGAKSFVRIKAVLRDSLYFIFFYVLLVWFLLFLLSDFINTSFSLEGEAAELVTLFCNYVSITFFFNGAIFIGNATFNNLGRATYSTVFNFAKATIFTIPFVYMGALWFKAPGILLGQAIGASFIGIIAMIFAYRYVQKLQYPNC